MGPGYRLPGAGVFRSAGGIGTDSDGEAGPCAPRLRLPPDVDRVSEGMAILRAVLQIDPLTKVIVITGNNDRSNAIKAVQSGAYDFIEKPVQIDVVT